MSSIRVLTSIKLVNAQGKLVEELFHGRLSKGIHMIRSVKRYSNQMMFLVMRTNEGLFTEKVIFE